MKHIIIIALLLLFVACGQEADVTEDADVQEQPSSQAIPATATVEEGPSEEPTEDGSVDAIKEFFSRKSDLEYMVSYEMETDGQVQEMTQYVSGSDLRTDMVVEEMEVRTYMTDAFYSCTEDDGWTCLKIDYEQPEYESIQSDVEQNYDDYSIAYTGTRAMAGTTASCYELIGDQGTVEYCLSNEHVPLYIRTESDGYLAEMTATTYSASVSDSVFELPAEATELQMPDMDDPCAMCENLPADAKDQCLASC